MCVCSLYDNDTLCLYVECMWNVCRMYNIDRLLDCIILTCYVCVWNECGMYNDYRLLSTCNIDKYIHTYINACIHTHTYIHTCTHT
jgi:hypothetical protein